MKKLLSAFFIGLLFFTISACSTNGTYTLQTTEQLTTNQTTTVDVPTDLPTTNTTTSIPSTTANNLVEVYIEEQTKTYYDLNEAFDPNSLVITAKYQLNNTIEIPYTQYSIRSFNTSSAGEKTAFIIYESFLIEYHYIVLEDYAFEITLDYYKSAVNLKENLLKVELNSIISNGFIELLYGDAIEVLEHSDVDPNQPNQIILLYPGDNGESVPTGYSSSINGYYWNREHVWPQSRLGANVSYTNDFPSKATDMHNLKPADPGENSSRSNDYFDYFSTSDTYEPNDNVKGDIARILFYMATKYFDLTLNDDVNSPSGDKTMGILSVLLEWNELDPVDDFERNRNDVIYSYQGNRNPFIDYPEFATLIWGEIE